MKRSSTLVMAGVDHDVLRDHLFPGDGKEAAAILVCTRDTGRRLKLLVRSVVPVPHDACRRKPDRLTWPTDVLDEWLDRTEEEGLALVLIHSHPSGYPEFSLLDDASDQELMPYLYPYARTEALWHGTAIMLPGGAIRARLYARDMTPQPIDLVAVHGEEINLCWHDDPPGPSILPFSAQMRAELSRLSVAIVGISGTGSLVAEMLLRMGVGELIVIDDDRVEPKNLNRILNSTAADAINRRLKVDVFKDAAALSHPGTRVIGVPERIGTWPAIRAAADADILFSCVDSVDGRHIADRLAASMLQPLFDVGVNIPVFHPRGRMRIANISGRIDFIQPGRSTLLDRRVYSPEQLAAEDLRRRNPEAFAQQVMEGYMPGSHEEAPAVISVNMRAASMVVQELVARLTRYRKDNGPYARTEFDLVIEETSHAPETEFPAQRALQTALGLGAPLLGLPALEDKRCA